MKPLHEVAVAKCGFYLPDHARCSTLLNLPESLDIAKAIEQAMAAIEEYKPELQGSLLKGEYYRLTRTEVDSYDKHLFAQKRDKVFELTLDLAINHQKWAA